MSDVRIYTSAAFAASGLTAYGGMLFYATPNGQINVPTGSSSPPTFKSAISVTGGIGVPHSQSIPAGASVGDTALWIVALDRTTFPTFPVEWTPVISGSVSVDGGSVIAVTRQLNGTEISPVTCTFADGHFASTMLVYSGSSGIDSYATVSDTTSTTNPWILPAISASTSITNCVTVWVGALDNTPSSLSVVINPPSGYTSRVINLNSATGWCPVTVADVVKLSAGSTGEVSGTADALVPGTVNAGKISLLVILKP